MKETTHSSPEEEESLNFPGRDRRYAPCKCLATRDKMPLKCDPSLVANGGSAADAARASGAEDHVKSEILELLQKYGL